LDLAASSVIDAAIRLAFITMDGPPRENGAMLNVANKAIALIDLSMSVTAIFRQLSTAQMAGL
jgi:hypothetical protein